MIFFNRFKKITLCAMVICLSGQMTIAQSIPVEMLGGDKKATLDILFFKFFKKADNTNTPWLFFNRTRVSVDYKMTETAYLPQFGCTEAISYNVPKWKGFAPVAVVQLLNRGVYPKLGVQYSHSAKDFTFFGWNVIETLHNPNVDLFILTRYTPKLSEHWRFYTQLEFFNSFPIYQAVGMTLEKNNLSFTQRVRLGLKRSAFQFGAAIDLNETGRGDYTNTTNMGGFLRYEFQ